MSDSPGGSSSPPTPVTINRGPNTVSKRRLRRPQSARGGAPGGGGSRSVWGAADMGSPGQGGGSSGAPPEDTQETRAWIQIGRRPRSEMRPGAVDPTITISRITVVYMTIFYQLET